MIRDLCQFILAGGWASFIIILAVLWACERVVVAYINRNKPECNCEEDCECDCDEEEIVASGGQVEDEDE